MTELKPCPFCGGEAVLVPTLDTTVREWFVTCGNIECNVLACKTKRFYTEAEAIEAWNTRHERTCEVVGIRYEEAWDEFCIELSCGCHLWRDDDEPPRYCEECGAKVRKVDE